MKSQKLSIASSPLTKHTTGSQEDIREDAWIPTTCYGCNHSPRAIKVWRVNGVAVDVKGDTDGPGFVELTPSRGRTCPKPYSLIQKLYNPYRIKSPMKRTMLKKEEE